MKAVFFSDVHLREPHRHNYRRMHEFLGQLRRDIDLLVINGDFFEMWVGESRAAENLYAPILKELADIKANGTRLVFIEGNHDFNLARSLGRHGFEVYPEQFRVEINGQRVLVEHGDRVTGDRLYHLFRDTLRSRPIQSAYHLVPSGLTLALGFGLSAVSRQRPQDEEAEIREKLLRHASQLFDTDVFITGHVHMPMDETIGGGNGPVRVINLGDWLENFTYLWVDDDGWELCRA
jgi:UDP-2,3-diacylglucosamine hydrolase